MEHGEKISVLSTWGGGGVRCTRALERMNIFQVMDCPLHELLGKNLLSRRDSVICSGFCVEQSACKIECDGQQKKEERCLHGKWN
jgi:hypothetical protein